MRREDNFTSSSNSKKAACTVINTDIVIHTAYHCVQCITQSLWFDQIRQLSVAEFQIWPLVFSKRMQLRDLSVSEKWNFTSKSKSYSYGGWRTADMPFPLPVYALCFPASVGRRVQCCLQRLWYKMDYFLGVGFRGLFVLLTFKFLLSYNKLAVV